MTLLITTRDASNHVSRHLSGYMNWKEGNDCSPANYEALDHKRSGKKICLG